MSLLVLVVLTFFHKNKALLLSPKYNKKSKKHASSTPIFFYILSGTCKPKTSAILSATVNAYFVNAKRDFCTAGSASLIGQS